MNARHRMLLRDLWHQRGQLLAAALVVACGIASFVSMRLTYESLLAARDSYYRVHRFADVFVHLKRAPDVMAQRLREIPGVAEVHTRVVMGVTLDVPGLAEPATGRLVSVPDRRQAMLNDLFLRRGRYIEPGSTEEVIASEAFAAANRLDVGDRVGAVINGRWKSLRIVGIALSPEFIFEVGPGALFPDNRRFGVLWMGHQALASAFDMDGAFNDAVFGLAAGAVVPDVLSRIDLVLERYGGLAAYGRDDHVSHRFITDEIAQNRISSTWIPGIFLGVAMFLLHLVLSRLVSLQRTQIGLLKAFGYGRGPVSLHYLQLAGATVSLGVVLGTGAGLYLGEGLTALYLDYYRFPALPLVFSPEVVGAGVGLSLVAAGLGAAGAVARAFELPPAEAMRPERPSSFHPGVLERTRLRRLLPPAGRMILRSIARRGWKSVLSALGIACAVGLLVLGGFFMDTLDYMLRVQFQDVQRDNVTVYFNQPGSAAVQHDVRHLPGVLHAEPFRTVPARLRFEHRSRRTEVTGLDAGGDLYQLLDRRLRRVGLPADGLLLSRKLADVLQVGAGDRVTVEVLEGERLVRSLEVAGVVDDLVGIFAYMDRAALNRLLREDSVASGARLRIDVRQSAQLYDTLKHMPAVAGSIFQEAALDSFEQILDRSLRVSTLINVVFACVIAFGVVYNGARVALSERGNELASLRVLGFTRREVAAMLLGEQVVLMLLAIPCGFTLGTWVSWFLSIQLDTEMYRVPLVLTPASFAFSALVVIAAALVSGIIVASRINRLDLIAVLKTRE
ncbi:MAG: ABC transporter permease [Betaproteobacteria bacterium]|nr:ABC transporter permease [Betaproteobacteria bacterium]